MWRAILALWLLGTSAAVAQTPRVLVHSKVNTYVDNDGNEVITPATDISAKAGEHVTIRAGVAFDVMSCASVDVVSAATPKGHFEETRQEYKGGLSVRFGEVTTDLSTIYSRENDYSSITASAGVSTELFARNTTLSLGYSFTDSNVGRAGDDLFERDLDSHTVTASVTQALTPELIIQGGYFMGYLGGYQSSPYRAVSLRTGVHTPERVPDERIRHSLVGSARWSPGADVFLGFDYRFYFDTWGLMGHTGQLTFTHQPVDWFSWRLRDRVYGQNGTSFYQEVYDGRYTWMTADRELGPFVGNLIGAKIRFLPPAIVGAFRINADLKVDAHWQWFSEYEKHPMRFMLVAEVGLDIEF